jgi:hypothetical protein
VKIESIQNSGNRRLNLHAGRDSSAVRQLVRFWQALRVPVNAQLTIFAAVSWRRYGEASAGGKPSAQKLAANRKNCGKYATGNVPHRGAAV